MTAVRTEHLQSFAERGYVVVPDVVAPHLVASAMSEIDRMIDQDPPPPEKRGFHFYWVDDIAASNPLLALLTESGAADIISAFIEPLRLALPSQAQVSLNIPPFQHRPGGPHLDRISVTEPSGRPGTFTMLAGFVLTNQMQPDMGNLWVWPGSHHVCAGCLTKHGPDALLNLEHPDYPMTPPEQVIGKAGDLLLGHYMLGHNMGGNLSKETRRVVYFRLKSEAHVTHWRNYVRNALLEFAPVRDAVAAMGNY
jgi:ectoine hydroxylase-related dioxygenase (phytanoyl-CoA dioxygenase family)